MKKNGPAGPSREKPRREERFPLPLFPGSGGTFWKKWQDFSKTILIFAETVSAEFINLLKAIHTMDSPYIVILAALLPVAVLLFYIYRRDKYEKEPVREILKGVGYGVLSVCVTFVLIEIIDATGLPALTAGLVSGEVNYAFWGAAIPEELAKLLMLCFFLRKNRHFDEHVDGIVYAVAVSMGFAAVENILYLFQNYDNWVGVGIARAIFSVPGHFAFAVFMGYYYALYRFAPPGRKAADLLLAWLVPTVAHGIYDSLIFLFGSLPGFFSVLIALAFLYFCYRIHRYAHRRIQQHLDRDRGMA